MGELYKRASLGAQTVKNLPAIWRPGFDLWVGMISWRRAWQPSLAFLPGESPWTEKPGRLQSVGWEKVGHSWATKHSKMVNKAVIKRGRKHYSNIFFHYCKYSYECLFLEEYWEQLREEINWKYGINRCTLLYVK